MEELKRLISHKEDESGLTVDTGTRRRVTLSPLSAYQKEPTMYTLSPTKGSTSPTKGNGSPTRKSPTGSPIKGMFIEENSTSPTKGMMMEGTLQSSSIKGQLPPLHSDQISPGASGLLSSIMLRKPQSLAYFLDLMTPTKLNAVKIVVEPNDDPSTPRSPLKGGMETPLQSNTTAEPLKQPELNLGGSILHADSVKQENGIPKDMGSLDAHKQHTVAQTAVHDGAKNNSSLLHSNPSFIQFPKIRGHLIRPPPQQISAEIQSKLARAQKQRQQILQDRKRQLQRYFHSLKLKLLLHDSRVRLDKLRLATQVELQQSVVELNRQMLNRRKREQVARHTEHVKRVQVLVKMKKMMELRRAVSESFCDYLKQEIEMDQETLWEGGVQKGLRVIIPEEEEYDAESVTVDKPRKSPDTYNSSPRPNRVGRYAADIETFLFRGRSPVVEETTSATIRRTKSLPQLVLENNSDSVFLDILSLLPPITRFTLRELDMDEVLANAQLRHDILFDPDLQFKTSHDDGAGEVEEGEEVDRENWGPGDSKTHAYWSSVNDEVNSGDLFRLPLLVSEIRAILIELLPNGMDIKEELESKLDAKFVHQQIEMGVMNPLPLFQYIADIMKLNCAPIRDNLVDEMVSECKNGKIVKALKICFDLLELMKLDYANHQLSRLRPYILENAVTFETKYFRQQVENGRLGLGNTYKWLKAEWQAHVEAQKKIQESTTGGDIYPQALMNVIAKAPRYNDSDDIVPETLHLDTQRLVSHFNTWQDITILSTILIVFKQASGPKCQNSDMDEAKTKLWVLLNDNESDMGHVAVQMAHLAAQIRGKSMSAEEVTMLQTMTEKTLAPGSKLYELIQTRLGVQLQRSLFSTPVGIDLPTLDKWGLMSVKDEINALMEKVKLLGYYNRAVYGSLYAKILEDIKAGVTSPLRDLFE